MNQKTATTKTTIEIDSNLLYQAKLKALKENKTLKTIIEESLTTNLNSTPNQASLETLADELIGSLKDTKNSNWQTKDSTQKWLKSLRSQWK